jgi:hypothetical protein
MKKSLLRKKLEFEGRFTQIPNAWIRDDRLGFRAKGILTLLMSHQDGWRISLESLADGQDGITAVRSAVEQLEEIGYLKRNVIRNQQNQFEGSEWIINDPFESVEESTLENPMSENPISGNPMSENQTLKNTNNKNTRELENNINNLFEHFWQIYPRKIAKGAAKKAFVKAVKKVDAVEIISKAVQYSEKSDLPEMQFIPHPSTWLNQERWTDDMSANGQKNSTTIASDILQRSKDLSKLLNQQQIES